MGTVRKVSALLFALTALAMSASAFISGRNGNVISREDAKAQSTQYGYDPLNRLTNSALQVSGVSSSCDASGRPGISAPSSSTTT